ncbi:hypothetical protein ABPG77_006742 [Micractinium sp. CCAP 211/92]
MMALAVTPSRPALSLSKAATSGSCPRLAAARLSRRQAAVRVFARAQPDDSEVPKAGTLAPSFTRRREHNVGRIAALGMSLGLVGELITGAGPITQLHYELGIPTNILYALILGAGAFGLIGINKDVSATYSKRNQQDVARRADPVNPFKQPRKFLVQNEVFVGRIAMAAFLGACVLEYLWGGDAPLVHVGLIKQGTSLIQAPIWYNVAVFVFFTTGLGLWSAAGDIGSDTESY